MKTPESWYPRRGEVYLAGLDKRRPAVVLSADFLNRASLDVTLVPITSVERRAFFLRVPIPAGTAGLTRHSWAKCDVITSLEKAALLYPPLGSIPDSLLAQIEDAVSTALDLD